LQEYSDIVIPDAWPNDYAVYEITGVERLGVLCDVHVPFHDKRALTVALDDFKQREVDGILLNGDFMDCVSVSWWEKRPEHRDFAREQKATKDVLAAIRKAFPQASIIYRAGNHEYRLERYLMTKAPEMYDVSEFSFDSLLGLAGFGIKWVAESTQIRMDKLHIVHGHEYRIGRGVVNPAKIALDRARKNVMLGHYHRIAEETHRAIDDKITGAWSVGCLCHLHPEFMRLNNWQHGYAVVDCSGGSFVVSNYRVIDGRIY
jgi:predicted phosphodiesterase